MTAVGAVAEALAEWVGPDPVDLLIGEPCAEPPTELREALARAAQDGAFGYAPAAGLDELRAALAARIRPEGRQLGPESVIITHGAKGGLFAVLATLVQPGGEVLHPVPGYPATAAITRRLCARPIGVPETDDGLAGWSHAVAERLSARTAAVVVASPSNPSGAVLPDADLERLAASCAAVGAHLVLDEAYAAFRFTGREAAHLDPSAVVRVGSASKTWAVCGWRIGWVIADPQLARRVAATQASLLNPPATPPQRALLELGRVPAAYLESARAEVRLRLDALRQAMAASGLASRDPDGGFFVWADARVRAGAEADGDTVAWCLDRARLDGVGLWPGDDFGCPGWVRAAVPRGDRWRSALAALSARL